MSTVYNPELNSLRHEYDGGRTTAYAGAISRTQDAGQQVHAQACGHMPVHHPSEVW